MASVELRDKNENLVISEDDWIFTQRASSPFAVEKLKMETLLNYIIPIGTRIMYDGATTPANFLYCDGSAVSRSTYADLFSAIGTTFGVGDGSTTFNIPNLQGLSPKGVGDATISGRTKTGPVSLGSVQEDGMQRITGGVAGITPNRNIFVSAFGAFTLSSSTGEKLVDDGAVTGGSPSFTFDSANSPDARVTGTTTANSWTRDSTIGTKFYIRYK